MWSRHLKYLRSSNSPMTQFCQAQSLYDRSIDMYDVRIYASAFRSLVHCHKALACVVNVYLYKGQGDKHCKEYIALAYIVMTDTDTDETQLQCYSLVHWLGAPEEHLSKDNTSVCPNATQQFLLGKEGGFHILSPVPIVLFQGRKCDRLL